MTLSELCAWVASGQEPLELELLSIEGGIYLLQVRVGSAVHPIRTRTGQALQLRSVTHAREVLEDLPAPVPFYLVHCVVHTEMCGFDHGPQEPLRVPLALDSAW
jgi:hypothetical protein